MSHGNEVSSTLVDRVAWNMSDPLTPGTSPTDVTSSLEMSHPTPDAWSSPFAIRNCHKDLLQALAQSLAFA